MIPINPLIVKPEGQGVVAHGRVGPDGTFVADELLAKHDEKYMPPEVAKALQDAGHPGAPAAGKPSLATSEASASPNSTVMQ